MGFFVKEGGSQSPALLMLARCYCSSCCWCEDYCFLLLIPDLFPNHCGSWTNAGWVGMPLAAGGFSQQCLSSGEQLEGGDEGDEDDEGQDLH